MLWYIIGYAIVIFIMIGILFKIDDDDCESLVDPMPWIMFCSIFWPITVIVYSSYKLTGKIIKRK